MGHRFDHCRARSHRGYHAVRPHGSDILVRRGPLNQPIPHLGIFGLRLQLAGFAGAQRHGGGGNINITGFVRQTILVGRRKHGAIAVFCRLSVLDQPFDRHLHDIPHRMGDGAIIKTDER